MLKKRIAFMAFTLLLALERMARGSHPTPSDLEKTLAVLAMGCLGLIIREWWQNNTGLQEDLKLVLRSMREGAVM